MAITGRMLARALERANVCSSKQADVIAREIDEEIALAAETARRKPGPKPKAAEPAPAPEASA